MPHPDFVLTTGNIFGTVDFSESLQANSGINRAAYTQGTYDLASNLKLTAGVRYTKDATSQVLRGNASGAVCRMILKNTSAVPLDQVLPVLVASLPLKNDYLENRPVFRAIFHLFHTQAAVWTPYLDSLLAVFFTVLDPNQPDQVGDDIREELLALISVLNAEIPDKVQAAGLGPFVR